MTKNGHADTPESSEKKQPDTSSGIPWWILALAAVFLCGSIVIAIRVGGVLVGLLFPPEPPTPESASLIEYEREIYGTDQWQYHTEPNTCEIITFYESEGGTCEMQVGHCTDLPRAEEKLQRESALAATCTGEVAFSVFNMRWTAEIFDYDTYTRIMLQREIPWAQATPEN